MRNKISVSQPKYRRKCQIYGSGILCFSCGERERKKREKKAEQAPNPVPYVAGSFYKVLWTPWGSKGQ